MKYLIKFLILFLSYSLSECYAGTIDPKVPDQKYIEYAENFPFIGLLVGTKEDDSPYAGSVVAYKPNIVITAAHLFHKNKQAAVIFDKKPILVEKIIIHPKYDYEKFGSYDIAICVLSENLELKWYPSLYIENNESGKISCLSGFGTTGNFITGVNRNSGQKRAGSNVIDNVNDHMLFCSPSLSHRKTSLEFLISPGDSGGGLFIDSKLAGIHSGVIEDKPNKGKSKYGAVSLHTRISKYYNWINDTVQVVERK